MSPAEDSEKEGGRTSTTDRRIAYALLRIVFGVDIFFHGLSRLLGDHAAFLAYLSQQMAKAPLPKSILPPFAAALPWTEAIIGLLLLLGLFTRFALVAGSLEMIVLMAGITLAQNWEVAGIQLIYCAIYFVLLTHRGRNFYSLDTLLPRRP
ncbi:MAG: DoxX family membrane protein [Candidatus Acidiferrales bacterium]